MSVKIKKFCQYQTLNYLEYLSEIQKKELYDLINSIPKSSVPKKKKGLYEIFKMYINKKDILSKDWIIEKRMGASGKDGKAYILSKPGSNKKYIMKEFKKNKSFNNVLKEVTFQTLASTRGVSPRIYEFGKSPKPYIIMDLIDGVTIIEYIRENKLFKKNKKLPIKIQKQIINANNILDELNILHNDENPRNYMIDKDDNFYVIDYGFSKYDKKNYGNAIPYRLREVMN